MYRKFLLAMLILTASLAAYAASEIEFDKMTLVVPKGDPQAGREAFLELGCTSCHAVVGETDFPLPKTAVPTPTLGPLHGKVAPGKLASAIVAPTHRINPEVQASTEGELSPMADFTEVMTVRQMVDLVAYVHSLGRK